jgi:hypothetical protein
VVGLGGGGGSAICQSACTAGPGGVALQLCATTADCPTGKVCQAEMAFGLHACL